MSQQTSTPSSSPTEKKPLGKGVIIIAVLAVVVVVLVLFTFVLIPIINRPRPEITMVQGYSSLQGLNIVFIVDSTVKNEGGAGWVKVYAEISGYGRYEKQDQRIYLASGESETLKFTFDVSLWGILGSPSIIYRVWAVAD